MQQRWVRALSRTMRILLVAAGWLVAGELAAECDLSIDLGRGPVAVQVPASYTDDPARPLPLLVTLHGHGASSARIEEAFGFGPLVDELGFIYVRPDGLVDRNGYQFWNATPVCCNDFGEQVDDSRYLRDLLEAVKSQCNVDRTRIYFMGHSNGGYMSYRMACDHAETITAIVSWAGMTFANPADCRPFKPVHVLHMHGTLDDVWLYDGGSFRGHDYPGALETAAIWSGYNGCSGRLVPAPRVLDLDFVVPGAETDDLRQLGACRPGGSVELWTIHGGDHFIHLTDEGRSAILEALLSRRSVCRGSERIAKARCSSRRGLVVRLARGLGGDAYEVRLSNGESVRGVLNTNGKAKVRFSDPEAGEGSVEVSWGCTAESSTAYRCP